MNSVIEGRGPDERGGTGARGRWRGVRRLAIGLGLAVLGASACAVLPEPAAVQAVAPGGEADGIVAEELADVFANAFDPRDTTVQVPSASGDPSAARLVAALADRGFGIQRVAADQGAHFLELARESAPLENGDTALSWRAAVGPVEVRRDYTLDADGTLSTAGPIRVAGGRTDITAADLESPPSLEVDPAHRRIEYAASDSPERPVPVISLITPELVEQVARDATRGRRDAPGPSVQALNASRVETGNLFYSENSNFGSTLDGRDRVTRRIVVFANDSLELGPENRQMIEAFVESAVARDDVISLVGCSNGPTALAIGNEGLALGRAKRVSEELVTHGVGAERIYDEGCWAPVSAGDRFPGRGVVIELWRAPA